MRQPIAALPEVPAGQLVALLPTQPGAQNEGPLAIRMQAPGDWHSIPSVQGP